MDFKFKNLFLCFSAIVSLFGPPAIADEPTFPSVEINGKFYEFAQAVKERGGTVLEKNSGELAIVKGNERFKVDANGNGLAEVQAAFFPESVLVNFKFDKAIGSANSYFDDRGPNPTIHTNKAGSCTGSTYLKNALGNHNVELRSKTKAVKGKFTIGASRMVTCTGFETLNCISN